MDEPRRLLAELSQLLQRELGDSLLGLYLFGSLAAGGFVDGRSDLDLLAVLDEDVDQSRLTRLTRLHGDFVEKHAAWNERVEVGFLGRKVLETFAGEPSGTVAVVSPGEPMHIGEVEWDWVLNWHDVCTQGEALYGPPPLMLGPTVSTEGYEQAVAAQLAAWQQDVRSPEVAYAPAHQGYIVVTVCRALYALATGRQTTKEAAVAWAAERYPDWADFVREALRRHRADVAESHNATIAFVDMAVADARKSGPPCRSRTATVRPEPLGTQDLVSSEGRGTRGAPLRRSG